MDAARNLDQLKERCRRSYNGKKYLAFHDECLRNLGGAAVAYRSGDIGGYRERLRQARRLIAHLKVRVDLMFDPPVARAANSLYGICERRLRRTALVPHLGTIRGVGQLLERIIEVQLFLLAEEDEKAE